ncbi:MAG: PspC domain-containing protein [Sphaerochaeta sp.]|jgi:phage shock protein PspC (stress-responsive transcriptional regulator)|uniref:PspC domain-containing protein n=1 Tax=Sphaerochaeta sp. TaxID=1972642 RepID=UPI002FC6628E
MEYYTREEGRTLYRERRGLILGVFQGLATWSGLPVGLLRIVGIVLLFSVGFVPVTIAYLLAAVMLPSR